MPPYNDFGRCQNPFRFKDGSVTGPPVGEPHKHLLIKYLDKNDRDTPGHRAFRRSQAVL